MQGNGAGICILVSQLSYGGAERQTAVFIEHLARQYAVRPLVYVMSTQLRPFGDRVKAAGCEIVQWERSRSYEVRRVLDIRRWLRQRRIRLLHAVHYQAVAYGHLATLGMSDVAFVPSIRSTVYDPSRTKRVFYRWILPHCRLVLANSHTGAAWLSDFYGVAGDRIRVVPNGLDPRVSEPRVPRPEVRRALGLPADAPVIAFVGKPKGHKDIPLLFRMFRRVLAERPDSHLVLMGWGLTQEWVARAYGEPTDRVHGLASRDDVYDVLAACDALALTSPTEGFPNAVLEAMALGVPPVTTSVGECPILISHGEDGFLFEPGDEAAGAGFLLQVLGDPALHRDMAERARAKVLDRYGTSSMVEATVRAYEDALGTPRATW